MKHFLPIIFILASLHLSAQNNGEVSKNLFTVNLLMPSLEWETRLTYNSTLDVNLGTGFAVVGGTMYDGTYFGVFPNLMAQYRHYYNLNRRLEKNKNILNNSGNYFAFHTGLYGGKPFIGELESTADYSMELGPVWGLQRVYGEKFKLDLHLGLGYKFNNLKESALGPIIGFRLGYVLIK